jgi:hypothetical protein
MPRIQRGWPTVALVIAATCAAAACTGTVASTPSAGSPSLAGVATSPPVNASDGPSATPSDDDTSPPTAALAAEGGDPVTGQLGTYVWAGGGSDSPWLKGALIAVGVNEPLTVAFQPAIDVVGWTVRFVPSSASDPAGARSLGTGADVPRFEAPEAGSWTIEVHVDFADGAGNASYFWLVTAS